MKLCKWRTLIDHPLAEVFRDFGDLSSRYCCNHFPGFENVLCKLTAIGTGTAHYSLSAEFSHVND